MGSGSLAAMAVMEAGFKDDMTVRPLNAAACGPLSLPSLLWRCCRLQEAEAVALVRAAIAGGIFNDLGSGGNCDVCIINAAGHTMHRGIDKQNEGSELRAKHTRPIARMIPRGATAVLKTVFEPRRLFSGELASAAAAAAAASTAAGAAMDLEA